MIADDQMGCELFVLSVVENNERQTGLFGGEMRFSAQAAETSASNVGNLGERYVLCGVSVPGETAWAQSLQTDRDESTQLAETLDSLAMDNVPELSVSRAPLTEQPSVTALIKFYNVPFGETLKATEVVDVVGILDVGYLPVTDWQLNSVETQAPLMPCVHVLFAEKSGAQALVPPLRIQCAPLTIEETRSALMNYLREALDGDVLAAEFLLLALIARIHVRRTGLTVGTLSLNLSNVVEGGHGLAHALAALVPALVDQTLRLDVLNDVRAPLFVQNTETGNQAGRLQLESGTCVLVDEVCMGEGELREHGMRNIRALAAVLQSHTLPYVFPYSEYDMPTDLNVVVLSTGKSLLPTDIQVPVRPASGKVFKISNTAPSAEPSLLDAWRLYLLERRSANVTIPEAVSEHIQADFVERRKSSSYAQEDLQRCLGIARCVSN